MNTEKTASADTATAKKRKSKTPAPLKPSQLVVICGGVLLRGMPDDEGGPAAWTHEREDVPTGEAVIALAVVQIADRPKWRALMSDRKKVLLVVSDVNITDEQRRSAAVCIATCIGTYTEALRLARAVRHVQIPSNAAPAEAANLVTNEIALARNEIGEEIDPSDVMVVLWKRHEHTFEGIPALELGQQICHAAFTHGTADVPAFTGDDDSDSWDEGRVS